MKRLSRNSVYPHMEVADFFRWKETLNYGWWVYVRKRGFFFLSWYTVEAVGAIGTEDEYRVRWYRSLSKQRALQAYDIVLTINWR